MRGVATELDRAMTYRRLCFLLVAAGTTASTHAQFDQVPVQHVSSATPAGGDRFGGAIALSADTLAVGAPGAMSGRVEIRGLVAGTWQLVATLAVPGLDADAEFGASLALQGDRLVVGAPQHRLGSPWMCGTAFVFERNAGTWTLAAQLDSGLPFALQQFGRSVALDGDRIVVGAPSAAPASSIQSGAAMVFERIGTQWIRTTTLAPSDAWHGYGFGSSVAVAANEVVVGAPDRHVLGASSPQGALYTFALGATGWHESQILVDNLPPSAGWQAQRVGRTIAFDGQTIVAGAADIPLDSFATLGAIVFERAGASFVAAQRLDSSTTLYWGSSVALAGDTIVVGARRSSVSAGDFAGAATQWQRQASGWTERRRLHDAPTELLAYFGAAVAVASGRIAVGSPGANWNSVDQAGAVALFDLTPSVGTLLCFGDGSGTSCPCAANTTTTHGPGCLHSLGRGALLVGQGSASVAANDMSVTAVQLVPGKTAMLAFRSGALNGGAGVPFHDGLLCIAGPGGRLGSRTAVQWPWSATWGPGLAAQIGASAGGSAHFQVWYRDPANACGGGSSLTNAFAVSFTP